MDFYPKFGFVPKKEYQYYKKVHIESKVTAKQVSMKTKEDWESFLLEKGNRRSQGIVEIHNDGLLMFYLSQFMQDNVYYIESVDAYVIAEVNDNTLLLHDIFAKGTISLEHIYEAFGLQIQKVVFAFVPKDTKGLTEFEVNREDSTFFLKGERIIEDMEQMKSFPEISHA